MSINLVLMQVPLVGEITGAIQGHPEAMQAYAGEHAKEVQKKQQSQVQKVQKEDKSRGVNPDGGGQGQQAAPRRQRQGRVVQEEEQEERPLTTKDDPWSGHILNKRI